MPDPDVLPEAERRFAGHHLDQVPAVADAITFAKRLTGLLRGWTADSLPHTIDTAFTTPLKDFAAGIGREIGAIQAALAAANTRLPKELSDAAANSAVLVQATDGPWNTVARADPQRTQSRLHLLDQAAFGARVARYTKYVVTKSSSRGVNSFSAARTFTV